MNIGANNIDKGLDIYLVIENNIIKSGFSKSRFEYIDTKSKLTSLKDTAKFYYALFSESGFDEKLMAEAKKESNLQLYVLSQIVNYR